MKIFSAQPYKKWTPGQKTGLNYYPHGPLARVEYGDNQVQGMDYAYTIYGWIKGVNSNILTATNDIGNDALQDINNPNKSFARDGFGYTLNYFTGDYYAIDPNKNDPLVSFESRIENPSNLYTAMKILMNGNINAMVTTLMKPDSFSTEKHY